ncbi:MAG: hypothetical protein FD180_2634 [Planctomycetota bacterium]|nr:MAG: hypothetical protein FD180_2634 [Planctomycetota bacterium]
MKNEAVVKASEAYVRILIRRPHAYAFVKGHTGAEFPGLSVLNAEGDLVATVGVGDNAAEVEKALTESAGQ